MIVADQNQINRRQLVEAQARRVVALWADKFKRAGALAPQRVGENIQAVLLDQQGGVVDISHSQLRALHSASHYWRGIWTGLRYPWQLRRTLELPLEYIGQAFMRLWFEVMKALAIKMRAARPAIRAAVAAE